MRVSGFQSLMMVLKTHVSMQQWLIFTLTISLFCPFSNGDFGIISVPVGIGVGVTGLGGVIYAGLKCRLYECCDDGRWFPRNVTGIKSVFQQNLYGQHLVSKGVFDALRSHLTKTKANPPSHPLGTILNIRNSTQKDELIICCNFCCQNSSIMSEKNGMEFYVSCSNIISNMLGNPTTPNCGFFYLLPRFLLHFP